MQISRQIAIRIKYLPKGTVTFETVQAQVHTGIVQKEPSNAKNSEYRAHASRS